MSALTLTFEKLPRSQRAGSVDCVARVCSSWVEAAAAATRSIQLRSTNTDNLQQWLHSRGASVLQVNLLQASGVITTLPCPKLQDLVLSNSSVDLRPGSQLLQDLCSAAALTSLHLHDGTYQGEPDLAAVLLALPNLQELCLLSECHEQYFQVQDSSQHASTASLLQDSPAPSLQLWSAHGDPADGLKTFTDNGMQFMCTLTKLRLLALSSTQGVTAAGLAGLHKLRGLENLTLWDLTCDISLSAVPAFSQLTALTALALYWEPDTPHCEFEPSVLAHTTQLERLSLASCIPARRTVGAAAELLSRLSQMPQLRALDFRCITGLEQCPPEAFSSLTSSSMLESLLWDAWTPFW